MAIATNAILRAVLSLALPDSVIAQNVFYAMFDNDGGSDDDDDVIDDLVDWIEDIFSSMLGAMSSQASLSDLKVYVYDSVGGDWDEVGTGIPAGVGTGVADMVPHGVAGLMHGYTTNPDVVGSKFLTGIQDTSVADSDITAGVLTNIVLAGADWLADFTGAATGSNFNPGVWSVTKTAFYEFQDKLVVNGQVAYQRRRKPGVGI